ncbi:AAA family ATPase [Sphingobacterium sp. SRCM116780]|uniref:AAA family ATPase n=1 Tax=Sphingobacterium sp. SRCM116780 TaxID=2907623 RepID=UPI001F1AEEA0|nr:AAA family ATPase [Sphingobacterium sp. SRCM116780]UIR56964.1 AAA family ATPase [Sphingobacterium sp. SRCM116780]
MKQQYINIIIKNNFYIITGGPGVGKTTLIHELERKKMNCVPEVARVIIKDQIKNNGKALPWQDPEEYSKLMLSYSIQDFIKLSNTDELYFFDRGIPDTYGYARLMNFNDDENLTHAVNKYRYNKMVFILPPWEEIYEQDNERQQDFQVAKETYQVMKDSYVRLGYSLIEVPHLPPAERVDFILSMIPKSIP